VRDDLAGNDSLVVLRLPMRVGSGVVDVHFGNDPVERRAMYLRYASSLAS